MISDDLARTLLTLFMDLIEVVEEEGCAVETFHGIDLAAMKKEIDRGLYQIGYSEAQIPEIWKGTINIDF